MDRSAIESSFDTAGVHSARAAPSGRTAQHRAGDTTRRRAATAC